MDPFESEAEYEYSIIMLGDRCVAKTAFTLQYVDHTFQRRVEPKDLENLGIRWDFDGEVEASGIVYNKFQVQPNAGKVPSTIREWREKNGGTHAIMGVMYVKKGGSAQDVADGWDNFQSEFKGSNSQASSSSQVVAGGSGSGVGGSSSSEWGWWSDEGIWYRQVQGVDEWRARRFRASRTVWNVL